MTKSFRGVESAEKRKRAIWRQLGKTGQGPLTSDPTTGMNPDILEAARKHRETKLKKAAESGERS